MVIAQKFRGPKNSLIDPHPLCHDGRETSQANAVAIIICTCFIVCFYYPEPIEKILKKKTFSSTLFNGSKPLFINQSLTDLSNEDIIVIVETVESDSTEIPVLMNLIRTKL